MVKTIQQQNKELYQCEECGFKYAEKEWAEKCQAWCKEHHSCHIEITAHAIPQDEASQKETAKIEDTQFKAKQFGILILVLAAIGGFFWLANLLGTGEKAQSEKPLVICQPQNALPEQQKCNWTAHIHADIRVFQDDKEVPLNFEQGELEKVHTHAEKDKLHWHGLFPVDPQTKEVKDWSQLSMLQLLKDLGLSIEDGPQIIVNGQEVDLLYHWKDEDIIEIRYVK